MYRIDSWEEAAFLLALGCLLLLLRRRGRGGERMPVAPGSASLEAIDGMIDAGRLDLAELEIELQLDDRPDDGELRARLVRVRQAR